MQNFNTDYEDGSGKRSPATGGSSGTQFVVGIVAMLLGSVFLFGGLACRTVARPGVDPRRMSRYSIILGNRANILSGSGV